MFGSSSKLITGSWAPMNGSCSIIDGACKLSPMLIRADRLMSSGLSSKLRYVSL